MTAHIDSEIGRLRRTLVHEPGPEIDRMVPAMMEELLFDDILLGDRAREEHARFRRVLQLFGVEVLEVQELLTEILHDSEARRWLVDSALSELSSEQPERLQPLDAKQLASMLVGGIRQPNAEHHSVNDPLFELTPLPNWCFQRDPQIVIGDSVVYSAMATAARDRESLLTRALFRFHPRLKGVPVLLDPLELGQNQPRYVSHRRSALEGGDVLVLSPELILVGWSTRTNRQAITLLTQSLARRENGPRWLVMVELPQRRAYMHLDTLLTPIDRDACLAFQPVIGTGSRDTRVFQVDLHSKSLNFESVPDLLPALANHGQELEPIWCGGTDAITQQREQWTDGANALALAPGVIVLYARNVETAAALSNHGFNVVHADELLLGRTELNIDDPKRTCILTPSHEMSRARGGPHCLTHPLLRDSL